MSDQERTEPSLQDIFDRLRTLHRHDEEISAQLEEIRTRQTVIALFLVGMLVVVYSRIDV